MGVIDAGQLVAELRGGVARGLTQGAELVVSTAVPLTPLETGELRSSLQVVPATPADLKAAAGSDLEYAVYQHEALGWRHDDGGPKFLERAVDATAADRTRILARAAADGLGA